MKNVKYWVLALTVLPCLYACGDDWLEPKPLSFYTPENTLTDANGLNAVLVACERNIRDEFFGDAAPIMTEMFVTDIGVIGKTDEADALIDLDSQMYPSRAKYYYGGKTGWYWDDGFEGISYANTVISRLDNATFTNEAERNAVLGRAYFHRSYRYYRLTHQYGDVPWIGAEVTTPKVDYYTHDRWSILEQCAKDMEFAYEWVPEDVDRGQVSKDACGMLLMKIYMALGEFDKAIPLGQEIISRHPLVTERFSFNLENPKTNLMFDIHSVEAKLDMNNKEGIMYVVSYPNVGDTGTRRINTMRNVTPYWAKGAAIRTPDGQSGTQIVPAAEDKGSEIDNDANYGRGIGYLRPTNYAQYGLWSGENEKNDLRSPHVPYSWTRMEDLYYNDPGLKKKGSPYYGTHLVKPAGMSVADTIRCWFMWPQYKVFVPDPTVTQDRRGGETPWYIYRSAETYLMLAECYYWKGNNNSEALAMLNAVRQRANAGLLTGSVGIKEILDERARELYYEELRHVELVRIAYLFAKTGKACEEFGGHVYRLDNFSGPNVVNLNSKDAGVNFYFDWVNKYNNFYNKGIVSPYGEYRMSVHHVLWPIPEAAVTANTGGVINQNIGYPGAEHNITPLKVGEEAPAPSL